MTKEQEALLLTVARLLRAHMNDHMNHPDFGFIDQDWVALNEALAPFDPLTGHGGDERAYPDAAGKEITDPFQHQLS